MEQPSENPKEAYNQAMKLFDKAGAQLARRGSEELKKGLVHIHVRTQELEDKYPDYEAYATYYALTIFTPAFDANTPDRKKVTKSDFPGPDSVIKYLTDLNRLLSEN